MRTIFAGTSVIFTATRRGCMICNAAETIWPRVTIGTACGESISRAVSCGYISPKIAAMFTTTSSRLDRTIAAIETTIAIATSSAIEIVTTIAGGITTIIATGTATITNVVTTSAAVTIITGTTV